MIRLQDVSVSIGRKRLVDTVSLEVPAGKVTAILGPNGAGKSTLLSLMAGDRHPDDGRVWFGDRRVSDISRRHLARRRAVMAQAVPVEFPYTVAEVVELGLLPWDGRPPSDRRDQLREQLDLGPLWHRRYPTLSGGERQRVQFARALTQLAGQDEGCALLLDEPTSALDLRHQHELLCLAQTVAARGVAVVVVLHDIALALAHADFAAVLNAGRLVAAGGTAQTLTTETLSDVYNLSVRVIQTAHGPAILAGPPHAGHARSGPV